MSRDDTPIDDFDCVLTVDDGHEENETVFLVFHKFTYEADTFYDAFYTHKKAQDYCDKMGKNFRAGTYIIKEVEIK